MMRTSSIVGVGLLALSFSPQGAFGMSVKQKQRNACSGMRSGEVSRGVPQQICLANQPSVISMSATSTERRDRAKGPRQCVG